MNTLPCKYCGVAYADHSDSVVVTKPWDAISNHTYTSPDDVGQAFNDNDPVATARALLDAAKEMIEDSLQGMSTELIRAFSIVPSYELYPMLNEHLEGRRNAVGPTV